MVSYVVRSIEWRWEIKVPGLSTSVFVIPGAAVKNGEDRLVVLNKAALSVIEEVRGEHPEYVFTYLICEFVKRVGGYEKNRSSRTKLQEQFCLCHRHDSRRECGAGSAA